MNIAIVGLGVVGGSLALALKGKENYNIFGLDINEDIINRAYELDMIDEGSVNAQDILYKSDVVIICLYPQALIKFLQKNKNNFKDNAILVDVTGIKGYILENVLENKPSNLDFIFTHPMAGREGKGIEFASAEVLKGANFLITPVEQNQEKNLSIVEQIAKDCGFGNISCISPEVHDKMIAYVSQISHVIAISLLNSDTQEYDTGKFVGSSYKGITRIANINQDLWAELLFGNKKNILDVIDNFVDQVQEVRECIANEDTEEIKKLFSNAFRIKREIIDKT